MAEFEPLLPVDVQEAYFPEDPAEVRKLAGGMINATLLVVPVEGDPVVLQQLGDMFNTKTVGDYAEVSFHLMKEGWEVPQVVETLDGDISYQDQAKKLWRATTFIDSDTSSDKTPDLPSYGALLGQLHQSLAPLRYKPQFMLPHFHNFDHYSAGLERAYPHLVTHEGQDLALTLANARNQFTQLKLQDTQLIHGDPRTDNILVRDGQPFTFIDWDTLMTGSVWTDIGDMLRSFGENEVMIGGPVPVDTLLEVAEAYRKEARPISTPEAFGRVALIAAQQIALELAMRFIQDYKDGNAGWFSWDETQYASRHHHNVARAEVQWRIFDGIAQYLKKTGS